MSNNSRNTVFDKLDLGTVVTTTNVEDFYVTVDPTIMMNDYADAVLHELERRNPLKYQAAIKQFGSDVTDVAHAYMAGLLAIRCESIQGECKVWRQAKQLVMTAVVQDALSCLGIIVDRAHGYRIIPQLKCQIEYDMNILLMFSSFLENFESDGLKLFKDAFPRSVYGDEDTMSCIIAENEEVMSFKVDAHPSFSYIAAFLGLKVFNSSHSLRYDVRYDLLSYISFMLIKEVVVCSF